MLDCCPASCKAAGADLFDTPCQPIPPPGERLGFRLKRAERAAAFAEAAYCGPTEELYNWTVGAAKRSDVRVTQMRFISADAFGYEHRRFAFVAKLPGLVEPNQTVVGLPLSAPENDRCREHVEWAFAVGRYEDDDDRFARTSYGHMKDLAGVPYENATLEDFHRLFYCGGDGVEWPCRTPPQTCTLPPCSACPVNPTPFTGGGCMVAFRGSTNAANFVSDALAFKINLTNPFNQNHSHVCDGCTVEHGFHTVWESLEKDVFGAMAELGCKHYKNIYISGHSLGAAVGTIAAAHFHLAGYYVKAAYLFQSPRVGNRRWASWFERELGDREIFRTSHHRDPVPDCPPSWMDFEHIGREIFFFGDKGDSFQVCQDDYECEHFKPSIRAGMHDHCALPIVPGGNICFCDRWID